MGAEVMMNCGEKVMHGELYVHITPTHTGLTRQVNLLVHLAQGLRDPLHGRGHGVMGLHCLLDIQTQRHEKHV